MTSGADSPWTDEVTKTCRSWGLTAIKSAYGEMYPACHDHIVAGIAKRIEESTFSKATSPRDYKAAVTKTLHSIRDLAVSSAGNASRQGVQANRVTRNTMNVSQSTLTPSFTARNQDLPRLNNDSCSVPDPSDLIKIVPFILEAGVRVLGKIETTQQVRAISNGKKSTIGFLAFEMMSKPKSRVERRVGAPSAAPFQGSLNGGIRRNVTSMNVRQKTISVQPQTTPPLSSSLIDSVNRALRGLDSSANQGIRNLGHPSGLAKETQISSSITLADLKAKYGEKIEKLAPLLETKFSQEKAGQGKDHENHLGREHIAFVRAALKQDNIASLGTLRSVKNVISQLLQKYGFLLNDTDIRTSEENQLNGDVACLENTENHSSDIDDSEELGETDSETDDDEDDDEDDDDEILNSLYEQGFIEPQGPQEEDLEQQVNVQNECGLADEDKQQESPLGQGETNTDAIEPHEFAEEYPDEILPRFRQADDNLPTDVQELNRNRRKSGTTTISDGSIIRELEQLCETIDKQNAETARDSTPTAYKSESAKDVSVSRHKNLRPETGENKPEGEANLVDSEDAPVPAVTPRRSMRIRNRASVADLKANVNAKSTAASVPAPLPMKATPTNPTNCYKFATNPRTRKTQRKTPKKTPRK